MKDLLQKIISFPIKPTEGALFALPLNFAIWAIGLGFIGKRFFRLPWWLGAALWLVLYLVWLQLARSAAVPSVAMSTGVSVSGSGTVTDNLTGSP